MYLDHFKLHKRPFALSLDPDFMVWTEQNRAVFDAIFAELHTAKPVSVLLGGIGSGKSMLAHALETRLEDEESTQVVRIASHLASAEEALQHVSHGFWGTTADASTAQIRARLSTGQAQGLRSVVIVDEAQSLSRAAACALLELTQDANRDTGCHMVLIGQMELAELLVHPVLEPFQASLNATRVLGALSSGDTAQFIAQRLDRAGRQGEGPFAPDAVAAIHRYAKGTPRLINKACDLVLLTAAQDGRDTVDAAYVQQVLRDFALPGGALTFPTGEATSPARNPEQTPEATAGSDPEEAADTPEPEAKNSPIGKSEICVSANQGMRLERALMATVKASPALPKPPFEPAPQPAPQPALQPKPMPAASEIPAEVASKNPPEKPVPPQNPSVSEPPDLAFVKPDAGASAKPRGRLGLAAALVLLMGGGLALGLVLWDPEQFPGFGALVPEDADPVEVQDQEQVLAAERAGTRERAALAAEAAAAKRELDRVAAQLAAQQAALSDATLQADQVQSARATAQADVSAARTQLEQLQADVAAEQSRLAALNTAARDAEAALADAQANDTISDDAFQGAETISATRDALSIVDLPRLDPVRIDDGRGAEFFLAALDSTDPETVAINYARGALRGHTRAALFLAQLFETGDGLVFAPGTAARWYEAANNPGYLLAPVPDAAPGPVQDVVVALSGGAEGALGEFVWQGASAVFTVDLADDTGRPIASAQTTLTAIALLLPDSARQWRVRTANGAASEWWSFDTAPR